MGETEEQIIRHNTIILQFNTIITMYVKEEAEFETKLKHIYDLIPVALYSIYLKKIFSSLLHFLLFYDFHKEFITFVLFLMCFPSFAD